MAEPACDDRILVDRFLAGRGEAGFRVLYRRLTPRLYGIALRLLDGDRARAEDAVQETWIRAARRLDQFEWRSSLSTWLAGFVVNVVREGRRTRPLETNDAETGADLIEPAPHDVVEALSIRGALAALPEGYRTVLTLHDVGGFTHPEIAAILGIDAGTSKSQLARARQKVRARLNPTRSAM